MPHLKARSSALPALILALLWLGASAPSRAQKPMPTAAASAPADHAVQNADTNCVTLLMGLGIVGTALVSNRRTERPVAR